MCVSFLRKLTYNVKWQSWFITSFLKMFSLFVFWSRFQESVWWVNSKIYVEKFMSKSLAINVPLKGRCVSLPIRCWKSIIWVFIQLISLVIASYCLAGACFTQLGKCWDRFNVCARLRRNWTKFTHLISITTMLEGVANWIKSLYKLVISSELRK